MCWEVHSIREDHMSQKERWDSLGFLQLQENSVKYHNKKELLSELLAMETADPTKRITAPERLMR